VDDEPDVLQLTKLIMKNIDVDGVPIKLYTASSKAEAVDLLNSEFMEEMGPGLLAVAFIDVVMETDSAGLDLCNFIRNDMRNPHTQLFIRTGQPGAAPERSVIDNYNISGYFTKVEATEDKLYTFVKSGVRQYWSSTFSQVSVMALTDVMNSFAAGEAVGKATAQKLEMMSQRRGGGSARMAIWAGNELIMPVGYTPAEAEASRKHLRQMPKFPIGPMGEMAVTDQDSHQSLIEIPATPTSPAATFVGDGYGVPDVWVFVMMAMSTRAIAALWQAAQMRNTV
jgi:hypothetical protein